MQEENTSGNVRLNARLGGDGDYQGNANIAIGDLSAFNFDSMEDRGVHVDYVYVSHGLSIPQFRPMTEEELAARDAKKLDA
jgi:hypothetical protein